MKRLLRSIDGFQRSHRVAGFIFAVNKKAGDDNTGPLIGNLAYVGFLSVFPLLLLAATLLQILAGSYPGVHAAIDRSIVAQMPIIGSQLVSHVSPLHRADVIGLVVGMVGLAWGATGLSGAGQFTMAQIWNVPGVDRPGYVQRLGRSGLFLALLAADVAATTVLGAFGTYGAHNVVLAVASQLLSVAANIAAYLGAFRVLTPRSVETRKLLWGSVVGGIAWTVLLAVGGFLIAHDLRNDTAVYGFFAVVLGLVAWIYLAARIFVMAAEVNVVLAYRLWPRSLVDPPLTAADRTSLALQVTTNRRRKYEQVNVAWDDPAEGDGREQAVGPAEVVSTEDAVSPKEAVSTEAQGRGLESAAPG